MLLREATRNKNNQELVKASIDALIEALEAGHSEALSTVGTFNKLRLTQMPLILDECNTLTRKKSQFTPARQP
jgi:nucleoid DNA-binding protein